MCLGRPRCAGLQRARMAATGVVCIFVVYYTHCSTVRSFALETSLWKLSAGLGPSFLRDVRNRLAGPESLSF